MERAENKIKFICKITYYKYNWHTPVFPVLRKQRLKDHKFKASLDYIEKNLGSKQIRIFMAVYTTDKMKL